MRHHLQVEGRIFQITMSHRALIEMSRPNPLLVVNFLKRRKRKEITRPSTPTRINLKNDMLILVGESQKSKKLNEKNAFRLMFFWYHIACITKLLKHNRIIWRWCYFVATVFGSASVWLRALSIVAVVGLMAIVVECVVIHKRKIRIVPHDGNHDVYHRRRRRWRSRHRHPYGCGGTKWKWVWGIADWFN